jgi:hypothetical protein
MADDRIFELRTYHPEPGKLDALQARFRDHTVGLFDKHGITVIGFWTSVDTADPAGELVYLLAFPDRAAAEKSWTEFRHDPAWIEARADSERNGPLVRALESVFLSPTDYSPLA